MNADLGVDPGVVGDGQSSEFDHLIYRISHDLRASVLALQELPTWISEDMDRLEPAIPAPTRRHLELMANHAGRLDLMLTGLLEFSRVGRMQQMVTLAPSEVLAQVLGDLDLGAGPRLTTQIEDGTIEMGATDLARVFTILLTNAVRFHPNQTPVVGISGARNADGLWRFSVTDNGPGIPEAKRDFILQPMTKLVSRDVDPGAGMGLAILNKIALFYDGRVEIATPASGAGTQVKVYLKGHRH